MVYELRPKQIEASDAGYKSLMRGNKRDILYCSCGFGKSLVIADIAFRLGQPTLILQPSVEILLQNYEKMLTYGVEGVTLYSNSAKSKEHGFITFATIQSIYKKPEEFKHYKYIIVDEAHAITPATMESMFGKFFLGIGDPPRIFLTGSPFRNTERLFTEKEMVEGRLVDHTYQSTYLTPLNRIRNKSAAKTGTPNYPFGSIIFKAEMMEQMEMGYLVRPTYDLSYSGGFDYSNLAMNSTGADFNAEALEQFVNEKNRLKQVIQAVRDYDSKVNSNLIFCSSLTQAGKCNEYAQKLGLNSAVVDGKLSAKVRKQMMHDFKSGALKHVFAYGVWGVGFDFPGLQAVTFARPTVSVPTYLQYASRVIRKDPNNPNKEAFIVDVAGVSKKLGRIETIRLTKEDNGYLDQVVSEVGVLTGRPLSKFRL